MASQDYEVRRAARRWERTWCRVLGWAFATLGRVFQRVGHVFQLGTHTPESIESLEDSGNFLRAHGLHDGSPRSTGGLR